jgi:eukaryotic-like serine/threonine-protein kinase
MKVEIKPERWQQIERLYNSVVGLEPSQRGAFLREACAGDKSLQQEIERLLLHQAQAEGFIESPALEVAARDLAIGLEGKQDSDMTGRSLSHYCVTEKIGEGGMGEVYRAFDEHLKRDVAIKILPAGTLADETARKRFRKEALALSKLNHPNIATVHDFDTQQGVDFLVMEYIPGITLSEKLATGPLPEKEVAGLGVQLAAGLEAAHHEGLIHRDLKPANLRLTPDGRLKILDFGLAKLIRMDMPDKSTESVARSHGIAGTLPYMAPEQLRAEPLDARTDIFSAGTVLYEMTVGERAFQETLTPRLIDAILHQVPPPPSTLNHSVSPALESVILKCLEKDPDNRYQSAKELAVDLRRLLSPGTNLQQVSPRKLRARKVVTIGLIFCALCLLALGLSLNIGGLRNRLLQGMNHQAIRSLAVLPLVNLSGDPGQEYFADGMTDELITKLSKISALRVIASTSVMHYKEVKTPLPEIARKLGVDAVIEGSVLRAGNHVRINVRLMGMAPERHLWANDYARDMQDILFLQSDVAQAIVREIKIAVTPQEQARLSTPRLVKQEAYDAYLKGRNLCEKPTTEGFEKGIEYLQQAIGMDPYFAPNYAAEADCYMRIALYGHSPSMPAYLKAEEAVLKALGLDETLAEGHSTLGSIKLFFEWDLSGPEREFRRALELNTSSLAVHTGYSFYLIVAGRFDEGIAEIKRAQELNPTSARTFTQAAWSYLTSRRFDEAILECKRAQELDRSVAHTLLAWLYARKGMRDEAGSELQKAIDFRYPRKDSVDGLAEDAWLASAYVLLDRRTEIVRQAEEWRERAAREYIDPYNLAVVYAGLGEKDRALELLKRAFEEHTPSMVLIFVDPVFDSMRSDPRFQSLVRQMNPTYK